MNYLKSSFSSIVTHRIALALTGILVLIYFYLANHYTINIPYWDDYDLAYFFLEKFDETDSFWEKLQLLFSFDNEHRIFTHRLILVSLYALTGELNLVHVMLIGNTGAIALCFFFWKIFEDDALYFLPLSLLLFVPADHIVNWEATAFVHPYLMLFSLLSLYFLIKKDRFSIVWAVFFAFLGTFTLGNGMFVFPAGFVALTWCQPLDKKKLAIWLAFMLVFMGLYFLNFEGQSSRTSLLGLLQNPLVTIAYPIVFFGAFFKSIYAENAYMVALFGGLVWLYVFCVLFLKWKFFKNHPFLTAGLLFILITVAVAVVSRSHLGMGAATAKRYHYIRLIFMVLLYIATFRIWTAKVKEYIGFILFLSCFIYLFRMAESVKHLKAYRSQLIGSLQYYEAGDSSRLLFPNPALAARYLEGAKSRGFYRPPEITKLRPVLSLAFVPQKENEQIQLAWEIIRDDGQLLVVKGWAYLKKRHTQALKHYLVLQSEQKSTMLLMNTQKRPDVRQYALSTDYIDNCGFHLVINKKTLSIPKGSYRVGVLLEYENLGQTAVRFSNRKLVFE